MLDKQCASAKPRKKPYKLSDGNGLVLEVMPSGSKLWRHRFKFNGKESMSSLGKYPKVKLKTARQLRDEQRDLIDAGIHPNQQRRQEKVKKLGTDSFRAVAEKFLHNLATKKQTRTAHDDVAAMFRNHVYDFIGATPIGAVKPSDIRKLLIRMEDSGIRANRVRANISRVMRYAVAHELCQFDPTPPRSTLKPSTSSFRISGYCRPRCRNAFGEVTPILR